MTQPLRTTPNRWLRRLKAAGTGLLAFVLAVVSAELFLRALVPVEVMFETWMTPGIQQYDEKYGAVYTPNWSGLMRHEDKLIRGVPLQLEAHGFRIPNRAGFEQYEGPPFQVVIIGGRSAIMSYGMEDDLTVSAALARRLSDQLRRPVVVHNTNWAGDNLHRNWNLFLDHLSNEVEFDAAVVCHINPYIVPFRDPANYDHIQPWGTEEDWFRYMPGVVLWVDNWIAELGPDVYRSYLGYGLVRLAIVGRKAYEHRILGEEDSHSRNLRVQSIPPSESDRKAYFDFLRHVRHWFSDHHAVTLNALIPRRYFPIDHHDVYTREMPADFDWVDLHRQLFEMTRDPDNFLADHHYNRALAEAIGVAMADELMPLIESSK